jgi:Transmembrane domain of unknown function (DUF3566)
VADEQQASSTTSPSTESAADSADGDAPAKSGWQEPNGHSPAGVPSLMSPGQPKTAPTEPGLGRPGPAHPGPVQPGAVPPGSAQPNTSQAGSGQPGYPSTMQPGPASTTPLPAAVGAAADAARGLASKVSAPFSGLTKPKPKGKAKPKGRPVDAGLPPRARPQARITPTQQGGLQARRAQLRLERVEPWSVMKFSFLISLVGWVILFVAVAILYAVLSKLGVFTSIEHTVGLVTSNKSNPAGSNASSWFRASRVLGYTMLIGAVNVVLITALATIGAVLYNLVTMLAGGIEVTLKESD